MYILSDPTTVKLSTAFAFWLGILFLLAITFVYIAARKRRSWLAVRKKALWLEEDFIP